MKTLSKYLTIFGREFRGYFYSPIAYIVIAVFLIITGWFFFSTFFIVKQAELRSFFSLLPIFFSLVVPAVTMRLFSEEVSSGSYEVLYTTPVTLQDIIAGKFLAATAFVAVMLAPTLSYAVFIAFMGQMDWGPVVGGYVGGVLLGAACASVGIFASALTRNQIVAFIIGLAICFALFWLDKVLFFLPGFMVKFFQYLGTDFHFSNIAKGVIDTGDVIYFASLCFVALHGTYLVMKEKE